MNNELVMTMKSLRKEFQDLNQQDQGAMQRKRKEIFPQVMMKTNFLLFKALYPS